MIMKARRTWVPWVVAVSMIIAVTAASAAFWIIFRVLEWRPEQNSLRIASALIMVGGPAQAHASDTGMALRRQHKLARSLFPCSLRHYDRAPPCAGCITPVSLRFNGTASLPA
jgi:NO-binding membrane sensor protein with MHYT domain